MKKSITGVKKSLGKLTNLNKKIEKGNVMIIKPNKFANSSTIGPFNQNKLLSTKCSSIDFLKNNKINQNSKKQYEYEESSIKDHLLRKEDTDDMMNSMKKELIVSRKENREKDIKIK